jgi:hypothetical protein
MTIHILFLIKTYSLKSPYFYIIISIILDIYIYRYGGMMMNRFDKHRGYTRMFKENHLTLGLFFPIESYEGSIPEMDIEKQLK